MSVAIESAPRLLLTIREAADALGISDRTLYALTAPRGPIVAIRAGRGVRYSVASLRKWIEEQEEVAERPAVPELAEATS